MGFLLLKLWAELRSGLRRTPPPCNSGIIGIEEGPNIIPIIPYSHYYWVGPPNSGPWIEGSQIRVQRGFQMRDISQLEDGRYGLKIHKPSACI